MDKVTARRARVVEAEPIDPGAIVELDVDGEPLGPAAGALRARARRAVDRRAAVARLMLRVGPRQPRRGARSARCSRRCRRRDPFAPATIVVGSHLVARWLTREIALARGIAAGLDLVTFDRFVERTWARPMASPRSIARSSRRRSRRCSPIDASSRELPPVARVPRSRAERWRSRRRRAASSSPSTSRSSCWDYALDAAGLDAGAASRAACRASSRATPTARWQAALIGEALRARRRPRATQRRRCRCCRGCAGAPSCRRRSSRRRSSVFGVSYPGARAARGADRSRGRRPTSRVYLLDPCEELWDDVAGRGARPRAPIRCRSRCGGAPVRDTLSALVERTGGDVDGAFVETRPRTARARAARRRAARGTLPSPRRRRRRRRDACSRARTRAARSRSSPHEPRAQLDADPTLRAHEIAVWIAGDAERYLAQAPSAFEAVGVPCHLIDAPIDDRGRIGEAVLALLELPTSDDDAPRSAARDDAPRGARRAIRTSTPTTGCAGPSGSASCTAPTPTRTPARTSRITAASSTGIRACAGSRSARSWSAIARPRPVRSAASRSCPRRCGPISRRARRRTRCSCARCAPTPRGSPRHEAPLTGWADVLVAPRRRVPRSRAAADDDARRDIERVRVDARRARARRSRRPARRLSRGARARGAPARRRARRPRRAARGRRDDRAARARCARCRSASRSSSGSTRARSRRGDQPSPLDLRRDARAPATSRRATAIATRSSRSLLGARDALYLSYVAVEAKSGQPLGPSSVVLELARCARAVSRRRVEPRRARPRSTRARAAAPLRRGDRRSRARGRARALGACACATRCARTSRARHADPRRGRHARAARSTRRRRRCAPRSALVDACPPSRARADTRQRPLSLANLRAFLESPVQAWAQAVLGLDELPDDDVARAQRRAVPRRSPGARACCCARCSPRSCASRRGDARRRATTRSCATSSCAASSRSACSARPRARSTSRTLARVARGARRRSRVGAATSRSRSGARRATTPSSGRRSSSSCRAAAPCGSSARPSCSRAAAAPRDVGDRAARRGRREASRHHLRGALDHLVLAAAGLAPRRPRARAARPTTATARARRPRAVDPGRGARVPRGARRASCSTAARLPAAVRRSSRARSTGEPPRAVAARRSARSASARSSAPTASPRRRTPPRSRSAGSRRWSRTRHDSGDDRAVARAGNSGGRSVSASRDPRRCRRRAIGSSSSRRRPAPARRTSSSTASSTSCSRGAELGQILLVTFTDKAVAELRLRIRDLLDRLSRARPARRSGGEPAWELDDAARARLRAAVTAFDHAPIFTIHGFCHRVLVEDAFAARRLFEQTQVADEVAFDAAFVALLRERFAIASRRIASCSPRTCRASETVDKLRDLLLACARTGARAAPRFDPERRRRARRRAARGVRHARTRATRCVARRRVARATTSATSPAGSRRSATRSTAGTASPSPATCSRCATRSARALEQAVRQAARRASRRSPRSRDRDCCAARRDARSTRRSRRRCCRA